MKVVWILCVKESFCRKNAYDDNNNCFNRATNYANAIVIASLKTIQIIIKLMKEKKQFSLQFIIFTNIQKYFPQLIKINTSDIWHP